MIKDMCLTFMCDVIIKVSQLVFNFVYFPISSQPMDFPKQLVNLICRHMQQVHHMTSHATYAFIQSFKLLTIYQYKLNN